MENLWTQLPHLIFSYRDDHTYFGNDDTHLCDYISFIDNTLNQCPANLNLKKFKLYINYNSVVNSKFKSRANSWIRYAISRNVEDVDLWLRDVGVGQEFTFEDEMFFKTSCITRMTLSFCRFNPPNGAISWERLECLYLWHVTLDEDMIEKILSGSPCLESLELDDCHGYRRIDVTSRSVKKLVFSDYYYCDESEVDYIDSELDYSIVPGTSDDITPEEILRGLLESLDHVKDVIINDFWWEFYDDLKARDDISNVPDKPNGVVERRNRTLVEFSHTMLIFSKAPLFLRAKAINTACYTQNRSLIRLRYNKTPYELMQDKKPDLSFFHVFGALCYPTNDNDDLGKLDAKADIGIFVGYTPAKKAFKIYNKRTHKIIETINVTFDELTAMASEQFSLGLGLHSMTHATSSLGFVPNLIPQQPCIPPPRDD
ncbi:retrovirus-related pol polyprotein from transposon TNT 1-94 [Tanacetum coccineum]